MSFVPISILHILLMITIGPTWPESKFPERQGTNMFGILSCIYQVGSVFLTLRQVILEVIILQNLKIAET